MAAFAARRLGEMADNTAGILAIEYLCAVQGIDLRAPLKTSPRLQRAVQLLRDLVPVYAEDRRHAPDIAAARAILEGELAELVDIDLSS
jgi:histidine ammonia-lyase